MYSLLRPLLFRLKAETAHNVAINTARIIGSSGKFVDSWFHYEHPSLRVSLWGLQFANPVGLAAGVDKNARLIDFWPRLGFGFAEVGSITYRPSRGNPRPRAFRLPEDRALVNRMGLNNDGAERIAARIGDRGMYHPFPLGINLAKTHDADLVGEDALADYVESFRLLAPAANYVALNISCPNTREGKTFEDAESLDRLLDEIFRVREEVNPRVPVLVKLSPPITERVVFDSLVEELVTVCLERRIQGFIATNTASDRDNLKTEARRLEAIGPGGLSGPPIASRSTQLISYLYRRTEGAIPIIGVGGIDSGEAAYAKIRAGATLVQLYTGLVYEGPGLVKRIKQRLVELAAEDNFTYVSQAVGTLPVL